MLYLHTDGACKGNPGKGGWAAIIVDGKREKELFGSCLHTTNNRMELLGVIKGLQEIGKMQDVTVFSDSRYVVNTINKGWLNAWKSNGWKTAAKKEVKNIDLWKQFLESYSPKKVTFKWVKGHAGDKYNERCDLLSNKAIEEESFVSDSGYEKKSPPEEQISLF